MATEKMRSGQTYTRPPSNTQKIHSSEGIGGKVTGKRTPFIVNNSAQSRSAAKKAPAPIPIIVSRSEPEVARLACAECETSNEIDSAFCKKCGAEIPAEDETPETAE